MHSSRSIGPWVVPLLLVALGAGPVSGWPASSLHGRVVQSDGATPRNGVIVALVDDEGREIARSRPTDDAGTFRIENAPSGRFSVLVDSGEGAFLGADPVELRPGQNPPLSLRLGAGGPNFERDHGFGSSRSRFPQWGKWAIVGVLGIAALFVVDELTEDQEELPASPF